MVLPRPLRPALALAGLLALTVSTGGALTRDGSVSRLPADSALVVGLNDRGRLDSIRTVLEPHILAARAGGDRPLLTRALLLRATAELTATQAQAAWPALRECLAYCESARDTALWARALRQQAIAEFWLGDPKAAERTGYRVLAMAMRAGDTLSVAEAQIMLGSLEHQRGDAASALARFRFAEGYARRADVPRVLANALNWQGNAALAQGRYADGRPLFEQVLELARRIPSTRFEAFALNNLGFVEARIGDPARALTYYRSSAELHRARQAYGDLIASLDNVALQMLSLGRLDDAGFTLREALHLAWDKGLGEEVPWQKQALGDVLRLQRRHGEAKRLYRDVIAMGDSAALSPRALCVLGLALSHQEQDSLAAALATLESLELRPDALPGREGLAQFMLAKAELLRLTGRPADALAIAREWVTRLEGDGDLEYALAAWTEVVRDQRALGRLTDAERSLASATDVWERSRRRSGSPEIREIRGEQAHALAVESVQLALAAGRGPAAAFDRVQRFKTRTLLERMAGPAAFTEQAPAWLDAPWPGLASFQRECLREGELLLEYVAGVDTTFLYAVTRDSCTLTGLPGTRALRQPLGVALAALGHAPDAGASSASDDGVARRLGELLLAGVGARISAARTVAIAPDGELHHVPFAALVPPGASQPLVATHRVITMPSAALFAHLRRGTHADGRGLLALVGAPRAGEAALPGAQREAQGLRGRFRDVRVWKAPGAHVALGGFAALHFAGHTDADDQMPWRSGFVIAHDVAGGDSMLTAAEIAAQRLEARLVVLSGCRSAGTRVRSGEGVSGLASAFLAAGVPAVVATLWPVDDRTTADLMGVFYDQLARGRDAADALRAAQAHLRARSATRHPFHWAGFVLVGEGETRLPLRRRPAVWPWLVAPLLAVAVMLALRPRRRVAEGAGPA